MRYLHHSKLDGIAQYVVQEARRDKWVRVGTRAATHNSVHSTQSRSRDTIFAIEIFVEEICAGGVVVGNIVRYGIVIIIEAFSKKLGFHRSVVGYVQNFFYKVIGGVAVGRPLKGEERGLRVVNRSS